MLFTTPFTTYTPVRTYDGEGSTETKADSRVVWGDLVLGDAKTELIVPAMAQVRIGDIIEAPYNLTIGTGGGTQMSVGNLGVNASDAAFVQGQFVGPDPADGIIKAANPAAGILATALILADCAIGQTPNWTDTGKMLVRVTTGVSPYAGASAWLTASGATTIKPATGTAQRIGTFACPATNGLAFCFINIAPNLI